LEIQWVKKSVLRLEEPMELLLEIQWVTKSVLRLEEPMELLLGKKSVTQWVMTTAKTLVPERLDDF
jgi:hypothetical protein